MTLSHEDLTQQINNRQKLTRKKTSWIWAHYIKSLNDNNKPVIACQVIKEDRTKCNIKLKHDGLTGNRSSHLWSAHKITKDGKQSEDSKQQFETKKHSEKRQIELCQFLTNWIIEDLQHFLVVNSTSFQAISVSLTTDLWTGQNRKGFIGITCSYVDSDFILKEITLTVQFVRYPHTAKNIAKYIENILNQWKIRHLTMTITTYNATNMKKCVKLLDGVSWIGCFSHTLQLVVGNGLFVTQNLILQVKHLIDFFMTPKQSERLEKIQKDHPSLANYEDDEEPVDSSETSRYLNAIADISTRWNSSYLA
ncbi:zinc finger BED domain-containing protein 4-like [Rhizophagus clarus]|uniref:Zinc finger BED domain-containing protein 4-like n=1 Tax=Rhizophagus clarus TaxID=94130 RepID=A0A8H3QBT7_9GLOM|nr:zinc finger BED domain-containing protein 4-like [Rhizophagus clarus]